MKKLALAAIAALTLNLAHAVDLEGFKFDDKIKLGNADLVVETAPASAQSSASVM